MFPLWPRCVDQGCYISDSGIAFPWLRKRGRLPEPAGGRATCSGATVALALLGCTRPPCCGGRTTVTPGAKVCVFPSVHPLPFLLLGWQESCLLSERAHPKGWEMPRVLGHSPYWGSLCICPSKQPCWSPLPPGPVPCYQAHISPCPSPCRLPLGTWRGHCLGAQR